MQKLALIFTLILSNLAFADWTENISINGDIRLRTEVIDKEETSERWRQRLRARLKLKANINEDIKATLRLATGASIGSKDNIASTNISNDSFGGNKAFNLDMAYITWKLYDQIVFEGGKVKNPLLRVGGSDLLWDGDLTPEGGHFKVNHNFGDINLFSNIVGYFIDENKEGEETSVLGGQLGLSFGDTVKIKMGGGYYAMNTEDFEPINSSTRNSLYDHDNDGGANTKEVYFNDYRVIEGFLMATVDAMGQPASFYVNVANNTEATTQRDAFLVGLRYGKAKEIGDFDINVNYRRIQKDAVFDQLNDGDFNGGVSDGEGYVFDIRYKFSKNSKFRVRYLTSDQGVSTNDDTTYNRYQVDWAFKF